ncbi:MULTISPECIES: toxin [unclassified Campylobacter]|uniref:toxin n=1 Tax=unclassified Campylobacter TaxID=2593542 RepID=UPI001EE4A95E|nr:MULTISPECIES: toxin [unclassified Campylobacter]
MIKNIVLMLLCLSFALADEAENIINNAGLSSTSSPTPRKDDFENVTNPVQIRNLRTGIAINLTRKGDLNTQNWLIRQIELSDVLVKRDKLRFKWDFGYVQFVRPENPDGCLAIGEDGFLHVKSCKQDLKLSKLETVFSIIPTSSSAVQIRSLVLDANECLFVFDNPSVAIQDRVGIGPCSLDYNFLIDTTELFFFTPALVKARALLPLK